MLTVSRAVSKGQLAAVRSIAAMGVGPRKMAVAAVGPKSNRFFLASSSSGQCIGIGVEDNGARWMRNSLSGDETNSRSTRPKKKSHIDFSPFEVQRHDAFLLFGATAADDDIISAWGEDRVGHTDVFKQLQSRFKGINDDILALIEERESNDIKLVKHLRIRCAGAIDAGDENEFMIVVQMAYMWMESLAPNHPFHWPKKYGFWWSPEAPANEVLRSMVRKLFGRVSGDIHNGSGIAVAGPRGVGKTHLLRLIVMLSGLLLPDRTVSCYVDYKSTNALNLPSALLSKALLDAPPSHSKLPPAVTKLLRRNERNDSPHIPSIDRIIGTAAREGRIVIFAADEISRVYGQPHWNELHSLATSTRTYALVSDGGSKLRAMIQRSDLQTLARHFPTFATSGNELPQSLNSDKLKIHTLQPLRTRRQYRKYLESRSVNPTALDSCIDALHTVSGGRLRCLDAFFTEMSTDPFPSGDSVDFFILDKMAQNKHYDAFDPPAFSFTEISNWLAEWCDKGRDIADIATLLDNNTIAEHPTKADKYSFGTPIDYFRVRGQMATVVEIEQQLFKVCKNAERI